MPAPTIAHPRSRSRRRALDVLFAADITGSAVADLLPHQPGVDKAARAIAEGVAEHAVEIDERIRTAADRWTIERMPVVDRNLLRIGVYEILFASGVPHGAAISDLVDLAKLLSTEDSPRFVNGLLGRVSRESGSASRPGR